MTNAGAVNFRSVRPFIRARLVAMPYEVGTEGFGLPLVVTATYWLTRSHSYGRTLTMRFRASLSTFVFATIFAVSAALAPPAVAAMACDHQFGSPHQLTDAGGAVVQEWIVSDLRTSAAVLPGYAARGQVWEASATVRAASGTVTPIIPNLYAVTADGQRYPFCGRSPAPRTSGQYPWPGPILDWCTLLRCHRLRAHGGHLRQRHDQADVVLQRVHDNVDGQLSYVR